MYCIQVWCHVWEITYLMPLVICIEICFSTCFTLLDHESWNFFHIITWYLLISIVKTLMGEPWGVWISVLAFFFLGWDMLLISCEPWFVIVLGWLGGWKKLLPISFSCSWKLLCYASSYVTQPIKWWFAVLQKEKTSQQSWRWRKNLWWHRYGCWLLSFHGISYSIMSHIGFSSQKAIDPNCQGTMMSWLSCMPENQAFYQWYTCQKHGWKKIGYLATKCCPHYNLVNLFSSSVHTHRI